MASMQDRLKLKRELCDTWSTREQLCLASSVLKSGDQNWNSVSKSLKPFVEKEALRPADWFSPKSCAIQYATLVENADTPKRKKRENNDITGVTTIGTAIVRQLTAERISEIRQIIASQRDEYQQLKQEVNLLKSGSISDEKLKKMWQVIEQEDKEAEQKEKAHSAWLVKRQQKQESSAKETANLSTPKKTLEIPCEPVDVSDDTQETEDDKKNQGGRSPLLTSLLKSPSPTTQVLNATSTAQTTSPTIASLLGATTKPHVAQNLTSQLNQIVVKSISSPMPSITSLTSMSVASSASGKEERPSVGAPTLSMMLQLPSNIPRSLPSQLNNNSAPTTPVVSSAPLKNIKTNVNEPVTRSVSVPLTPVVDNSPVQVIEPAVAEVTDTETIDKDEINEIIDDIEELIKEEISPEAKAASVSIVETIKEEEKEEPIVHTVNEEEIQNLNESESPDLDSSQNDITMELIEQDTSKIAEIIGASPEIQAPSPLVEPEKPIEIKIESVEEKKEEEEEKKSSPLVVTIKEEVEDISTDKIDEEIKTEIIVEENIVPEEKVEEIPEVVEKNKEKESTNDVVVVVEKDTTEEIPVEKDVINEEKEIKEKEQEQKDEKEQEQKDDEKEQEKDVEKEKEGEKKQKEDKKVEEKEEIVAPVEVEEPKKEEEKVEITIEPLLEVKDTEVEEEKKEEEQQQQQDEIMEENIVEKISEKPKESNDVVEVEKSTEISSIVEDDESVQEIVKESGPCQDIKAVCEEEKKEVEEKKDIVIEATVKLEVEESKEPSTEVKIENNSNEPIVKEAIIKEVSVKEPSKTSSPSTDDLKKEKKEIPKILDKPSEINSSPIPTKSKTPTTTPKISKPSEDKKVEIKIIKSVQEDQATDVEDKIPHSKIPIRMDINDDKKNDNNKTIEKIDKEIKIEDSIKKDIVKIKKQETPSVSSIDDIEEEESSMTKLSGRAIKTYSKKQNVSIDSEPETDTSEGADYRAWKKAIILVFNRLATHRFSSLFLKPITEENAPGYHSVVFRPMDLSTIKKNIDNGTIRSTTQFQRDVMLMFQNAIMYNKHDTRVHKMTLDMQEECLEQMQVLVEVAAEGPVRRETRTAANSSISEANDNNILKRKRSLITPSPLDSDSPRFKKRRKSEND